ncbi:uncharacterized protein A4U43_C07F37370 [Asparagus officinalis]|uniref:DUF569 domain-containing protein n=1 Tax=Asparagus officinalis TaxID=4686 RepID=A0A5P1EI87_ASPOF|nr:uncharacterized protein A4U43_C07F37370 [Asparagus officinalis]
MELFKSARTVRLKSHHEKYLQTDDDGEHVIQDRTAPPGVRRVPARSDVRLRTRYGHYLRANGGLPPWRNSITHDIPHRTTTQDWVLWDVEVVEVLQHQEWREKQQETKIYAPPPPPPETEERWGESLTEDTPSRTPSNSTKSPGRLSRDESLPSFSGSPHKSDGRSIYYVIAEDDGTIDNSTELCLTFKGTDVKELTEKLAEVTEIDDGIIVCSKNPFNGMLCPLLLHLPPNNTTMHVVVVRSSSEG